MSTTTRVIRWTDGAPQSEADPEHLSLRSSREWLVTNGLGGYCSGTLLGRPTRRFHGLLIAALPPPLGRMVMLNHVSEWLTTATGLRLRIGAPLGPEEGDPELALLEFRLENGLPTWRYGNEEGVLERTIWMTHGRNETWVAYRFDGLDPMTLKLRPWFDVRAHCGALEHPLAQVYDVGLEAREDAVALTLVGLPAAQALRLSVAGEGRFVAERQRLKVSYAVERSRGYDARGQLQSPGFFELPLGRGRAVTLTAQVGGEPLAPHQAAVSLAEERARRSRLQDRALAATPAIADSPLASELVMAADQFLVEPVYRGCPTGSIHHRTIIAGYPWFTDWGRDTMISLEGLTLVTGRADEARLILLTFAEAIRDGLIPNLFPEGELGGLYHTADATLWFFHAIDRYLQATRDHQLLDELLPKLRAIIESHFGGTCFGIKVDAQDGLLRQGAAGYQLTWMDAKVGDLIVTPRRGKAVEINALFYNALRLLAQWNEMTGDQAGAKELDGHAARCRRSFNERFWLPEREYLADVVDGEQGDDPALRPNQILSISLSHPVLEESRWGAVIRAVTDALLTPVGLRSLAPGEPDYQPFYFGDRRARDLAYHEGTVWPWLIGPYVTAWRRQHRASPQEARAFLDGFAAHLSETCVGTISEIFDAEPPFTARGCFAQAWSVAEVLRSLVSE